MGLFQCVFLIFFIANSFASSKKGCLIRITENKKNVPFFEKNFGTARLKIPIIDSNGAVFLRDGETITGNCASKFEPLEYFFEKLPDEVENYDNHYYHNDAYTATFKCISGQIKFLITKYDVYSTLLATEYLSCRDFEWNIYESETKHQWCSEKANSYILATEAYEQTISIAAVCFNLENMLLESISYTLDERNALLNQEKALVYHPQWWSISLGVKIDNFHSLMEDDILRHSHDFDYNQNEFTTVAMRDLDLIMQGRSGEDYFHNYGEFLKINWWYGLLHGNWKRFTRALNQQSLKSPYDIIMGVSGGVKEPYFDNCSKEGVNNQKPKFVEHNETLPAYVWAYLNATISSEEFVVIGYNSPFFEFFDSKETVFCKDICEEIPWLKDVSSTFSYSALGVVFCCTPDDVRNSGALKGFPNNIKAIEPTTE